MGVFVGTQEMKCLTVKLKAFAVRKVSLYPPHQLLI